MSTLLDLARKMQGINEHIPIAANEAKKDVARAILNDLTQVTPADTGAAISNWQVGDVPVESSIEPYQPSPKGKMVKGVWTHAVEPSITAQANAPVAFEIGRLKIEVSLPSRPIFISNVVPYIKKLDEGSSTQAPAGFVDRAMILGRNVIEKAKLLL